MSKPQWTDATSYQQGERGKVEPRCWSLDTPLLTINVHRHVHYSPDIWLVSCSEIGIYCDELESRSALNARHEAIKHVRRRVRRFMQCLNSIKPEATTE